MNGNMLTGLMVLIVLGVCGCCAGFAAAAEGILLEVQAGKHDRRGAPVFFELPKALAGKAHFTLTRVDTNRAVAVQTEAGAKPRVVWLIGDALQAGRTRRYRLAPASAPPKAKAGVSIKDDGKGLRVQVGRRPVLVYNHAVVPSPDPKQAYYRRSGYIHPVFNPSGQRVTDDFAPDHMHQHGIMFPWTNTTFEGRKIDFWNQAAQQGTVQHARLQATGGGPVFAFFTAVLNHVAFKVPGSARAKPGSAAAKPGGPKNALIETWTVQVYNRSDGFLFDVESTQRCGTDSPLNIQKYHYGGMAIRAARQWLRKGKGDFLTSEGHTRKDGNHTRPRWVDIYGQIGRKTSGVTIFCHPGNFRFPQPVRLHPNKPYFCFAPMVLGRFQIKPPKPYVSKYRFHVHDGRPDPAAAERLWNDYAHPPEVRVVKE